MLAPRSPLVVCGAVVISLALSGTSSYAQEKAPSDFDKLQGNWVCAVSIRDGKQVNDFVGVRLELARNTLTWSFPKPDGAVGKQQGTFTLDPEQAPKHFDWIDERSPDRPHRRLYVLEGDLFIMSCNVLKTETVSGPGQRPKSLSDGQYLFVMKRLPAAR